MAAEQLSGAEAEIAEGIRDVHRESYGGEITAISVITEEETVIVIADVEPTPAERTLLAGGHHDAVAAAREAYQKVIGATFTAIVERATGRRVVSFLSTMCTDPLYMVELFRLAPASYE